MAASSLTSCSAVCNVNLPILFSSRALPFRVAELEELDDCTVAKFSGKRIVDDGERIVDDNRRFFSS